jgi:hypothetical protein
MKKKGLKGLLMVLVMVMGLALAMGPANAACTVHMGLPVGTAGVQGTTIGFVWDVFGTHLIYAYTTDDHMIANALMASTNYDLLLGLVWGLFEGEHEHAVFPFPFPTMHITGDAAACPTSDFDYAGNVVVYNYSAVGFLRTWVPEGLIDFFQQP